jgi:integrase
VNVARHPLCVAANELDQLLVSTGGGNSKLYDFNNIEVMQDWFHPEHRWHLEEDLRARAGSALNYEPIDPEDIAVVDYKQRQIQPLQDAFIEEFRIVLAENQTPKKRGKLFTDVADEYHSSHLFLQNKKTNTRKRQKTIDKEKRYVRKFIDWVGSAATVDEFGPRLGTDYAEALAKADSGLIDFRGTAPSAETIEAHFSSVRNVLDWAWRREYIPLNPWRGLNLGGYGEPREPKRDWTEDELRQVFSLSMPPQDRLCLAILAYTGARLDEIALLEWDQFSEATAPNGETVHWIDTTDAIVKNKPSRRLIPIIPKIAELIKAHPRGLNKQEPDRLFTYKRQGPDRKAENKASFALMKHLRKVSSDRDFAVHGLRHTFTTWCRGKIDWEVREFLMGRGGEGEGANYGQAAHIQDVMAQLDFLDTSYLDGFPAIENKAAV